MNFTLITERNQASQRRSVNSKSNGNNINSFQDNRDEVLQYKSMQQGMQEAIQRMKNTAIVTNTNPGTHEVALNVFSAARNEGQSTEDNPYIPSVNTLGAKTDVKDAAKSAGNADLPIINVSHGSADGVKLSPKLGDYMSGENLIGEMEKAGLSPDKAPFLVAHSCDAGMGNLAESMSKSAKVPVVGPMGKLRTDGEVIPFIHPTSSPDAYADQKLTAPENVKYSLTFPGDPTNVPMGQIASLGYGKPISDPSEKAKVVDAIDKGRSHDSKFSNEELQYWKADRDKDEKVKEELEPKIDKGKWAEKVDARTKSIKDYLALAKSVNQ